ncbi:MFS transporter [Conexibacter woesei]|uniref:MFS transporter n=1 Tax=Conexibacter woesei TaxID=191495 RepID=UPI0006847926|nr:MFS transporter [Conexibacter woesei]
MTSLPSAPPALPRQRLLLAAVMSGLMLAMLDQTIVGTALPRVVADLHGQQLYLWVVTAYLVPATVTLPLYARLSDRFGRRPLLLAGMSLFLVGSALAALAPSMGWLVAARAVQGGGAGALESLSFILVADLYAGRRNAALQGAMAGMMGFAFIAGPLIGGFLTDHVDWRACFTVNLPIGAAALVAVARVLPGDIGKSEARGVPLDLAGIALLTGAVGLLLVGLNEKTHGSGATDALPGWTEPRTGGLIVLGLLMLAALVRVEWRAPAPIIPLRLLAADRRLAAICAAGTASAFGLFCGVLLLPRYFQFARGVSATHSGLLIYPLLLGLVVAVNVGAALIVRRLEWRGPILAGMGLMALGALGFATFDSGTPDALSLLYMALIGLGVGPALSGLQIALQRTVEPARIGAAMGTLLLLRQLGGAIALAGAETLYSSRLSHALASGDAPREAAASATGTAVFVVALCGAGVAAVALLSLGRGAGRLQPLPEQVVAAAA